MVTDRLDASRRYSDPASPCSAAGGPKALSRRQHEVLALLAEGVGAREIAGRLHLAEPTVRNHIRGILRKLGCHSQLEAVAVAYRLQIIPRRGP